MKVHSFVTEMHDPVERGRQIGERWAKQIRHTTGLYLEFLPRVGVNVERVRRIGDDSLGALEAWCPELAKEVMAMAAGADLPFWQLASLNARTEILAAMPPTEGECSTSVYVPANDQPPRTLQTWDWHDSLAPEGLLLQFTSHRDLTVKLFTEFGMLGKIGVNSAGLGLHFNILHHESDHDGGGVPVHAVARRLLEEATSVQEAIDLARTATLGASTVLTVFSCHDQAPRAACIELSPSGVAVVPPREDGWLLHTNHFLDPVLCQGERTPDKLTTYDRLAHLEAMANVMASGDVRARAQAMCGSTGDRAPICMHADMSMPDTERWETLISIGIDTVAGVLEYAEGNPTHLASQGPQRF